MTCLCGYKGINCNQGRKCPLGKPECPPNDLEPLKPGLSPQLLRNLAIYIGLILLALVSCGALKLW